MGGHFPHLVEIRHLPDRTGRAPSQATSSEVRALDPIEAAKSFWDELSTEPLTSADEKLLGEVLAEAFSADVDDASLGDHAAGGATTPSMAGIGAQP